MFIFTIDYMIDRLFEFIQSLGISVRSFEQAISASDGMLRRAINKNTDIQSKWLSQIAENYPQLNITWLITGKGEMLLSPETKSSDQGQEDKKLTPALSPEPKDDFNPSDPKWNADFSDASDNDDCLHCIEKERIIEALMAVIASKQDVIRAKEDIIHCKDDLINELSRKSKNATESPE